MKKSIREPSEKLPIRLLRLEVGAFKANCYLIWDEKGNCVIIDAGEDAEFIEEKVRELRLAPKIILATHGHFDHLTAASSLSLAYSIPLYMSKKDKFLFRNLKEFPPLISKNQKEGDEVKVGDIFLEVLEVPGHTPGSLAYKLRNTPYVFSGDVFFADGSWGRTDFGYSDKETLQKSILRLRKLSPKTIFCPGHAEEFANL